jgi:pectate lyase
MTNPTTTRVRKGPPIITLLAERSKMSSATDFKTGYNMHGKRKATLVLLTFSYLINFCFSLSFVKGGIPAFPGAGGYGAQSVGGRGGRVIEVTNLNDTGPGSFRSAVTTPGRRIVVFRIGGTLELKSRIDIGHPYLTIAGQTAPGGGITLKGTSEGGGQMLRIRTHDVVVRYLRIRSGAHGRPGRSQVNISLDPIPARGDRFGDVYNIMIDHVSVSWTLDENIAIHRNVPEDDPNAWRAHPKIYDVSIQQCLIAEGLYPHSTGIQTGGERIARGGKSIYNGGHGVLRLSIHRNLFANTSHRNPALGCKSAQVVNNVMYNWSSKCSETHDAIMVDWIANYYKPGPLSDPRRLIVHNPFFKGYSQYRFADPSIFMSGNVNAQIPEQKDWQMYTIHYEERPLPASWRRAEPMFDAVCPVPILSAPQAYEWVLADVGANARLNSLGERVPNPDATDRRIINDVRNGTGAGVLFEGKRVHYMHPDQVGGFAKIEPGMAYADSDHDGMSDAWETKHGFNPQAPSDRGDDTDRDGYTNIEEFLNSTNPKARNE